MASQVDYNDPIYRDVDPHRGTQQLMMSVGDMAQSIDASLLWVDGTGSVVAGDASTLVFGAFTDSRQVEPDSAYVARIGEEMDGHRFIAAAINAGATAIIATDKQQACDQISQADHVKAPIALFIVDDATLAFGHLAQAHVRAITRYRQQRGDKFSVIGVTGSAGKTTTKDLLTYVLSTWAPTVGPKLSFNNEVGLPATMLEAGTNTRFLVLEMGASGPGHIAYLTQFIDVDIAIELMVGVAHLGGYASIDELTDTKAALVESLHANGHAILNADDPRVAAMAKRTKASITYFSPSGSDHRGVWADNIEVDSDGRPHFDIPGVHIHIDSPIVGRHHIGNILAAVCAAQVLGMPNNAIETAVNSFTPVSRHRMDIHILDDDVMIIDDSFNANPDSVKAALMSLHDISASRPGKTVLVLGEMLELGPTSDELHRRVGRQAVEAGCDLVIIVGEEAHCIADEISSQVEVLLPESLAKARRLMEERISCGDTVLIKGSHGSGVWELADQVLAAGSVKE